MATPKSIGQFGKTEEFFLQVARGQVQGHSIVIRSGSNPHLDPGARRSLWDHDIASPQPFPAAASTVTVSSSDAADTLLGTGARSVQVSGLDAAYNPIDELVVLNGQTPVTSARSYLRVFAVAVVSAGSSGANVGDIYVGTGAVAAGVPALVLMRARPSNNVSQSAVYTVPAGYTAYLVDIFASATQGSTNQNTVFYLRTSRQGSPFMRQGNVIIMGLAVTLEFHLYRGFPEKTDIDVNVETADTGAAAAGQLRYLLVKNDSENA